jgi:hypothetical protein
MFCSLKWFFFVLSLFSSFAPLVGVGTTCFLYVVIKIRHLFLRPAVCLTSTLLGNGLCFLYVNIRKLNNIEFEIEKLGSLSSTHYSPLLDIGLSNRLPSRSIFGYSHPAHASRPTQIVTPPGLRSYTTFTETQSPLQN